MAEGLLYDVHGGATVERVAGCRVPEPVRRNRGRHAGLPGCTADNRMDASARERSALALEDMGDPPYAWRPQFPQGRPRGSADEHRTGFAALAEEGKLTAGGAVLAALDAIPPTERRDFAGAAAGAVQRQ